MGKTAFVFPGQGSQYVGMGKELRENFRIGRDLFAEAAESLGFDLTKICFEGPEEELKKTEITQPAILVVSAIAYEVLRERGIYANAVAGHSLGEYSALYAASSISFSDAVRIVHLRGKFMQEAVPIGRGTMSAVLGLPAPKIFEICKRINSGVVEVANLNSEEQVVISGETLAVHEAGKLLKEAGAKRIIPLSVSAPFHCLLMKPAAEKLEQELSKIKIKDALIPVVANVTADYVTNSKDIRSLLIKQITSPVRWEESIKKLIGDGFSHFIEVGPRKVLSGLIKNIDKSANIYNVEDMGSLQNTVKEVLK